MHVMRIHGKYEEIHSTPYSPIQIIIHAKPSRHRNMYNPMLKLHLHKQINEINDSTEK